MYRQKGRRLEKVARTDACEYQPGRNFDRRRRASVIYPTCGSRFVIFEWVPRVLQHGPRADPPPPHPEKDCPPVCLCVKLSCTLMNTGSRKDVPQERPAKKRGFIYCPHSHSPNSTDTETITILDAVDYILFMSAKLECGLVWLSLVHQHTGPSTGGKKRAACLFFLLSPCTSFRKSTKEPQTIFMYCTEFKCCIWPSESYFLIFDLNIFVCGIVRDWTRPVLVTRGQRSEQRTIFHIIFMNMDPVEALVH